MGYQHIRILRDLIPLGPDFGASLQVESPIVEPGLPGAAVESHPVNSNFLVLEIDAVGQDLLAGFSVSLKTEIMVAGDDDLVGMGEGAKKVIEINDLFQCSVIAEVAGVDKDISVWDIQRPLQAVSVANGDDFH